MESVTLSFQQLEETDADALALADGDGGRASGSVEGISGDTKRLSKIIHEQNCLIKEGIVFDFPGGSTELETESSWWSIEVIFNGRPKKWAQ